jgi:hypothetical protein
MQCEDGEAVELFIAIAKFNPKERIDIQRVIGHGYFDGIRKMEERVVFRDRLIRFLRGNYNISKDSSYSFYGIDGLLMPQGI